MEGGGITIHRIPGSGGFGGVGAVPIPGSSSPMPGGIPSAAGPMGSSPLTNPLVAARFSPTLFPTRLTLINDNSANAAGLVTTPVSVYVDRPTLVVPIDNLNSVGLSYQTNGTLSANALTGGQILYWPEKRMPTAGQDALVSNRHGICYLSGPGTWWLTLTNVQPLAVSSLNCLLLDASDTGTAARILQEPGCNGALIPSATANSYFQTIVCPGPGVDGTPGRICPASRQRTALVIQNTGTVTGAPPTTSNRSIRLSFGVNFSTLGGAGSAFIRGQTGILLGAGASITLSGDTLFKGTVFGIADQAATAGSVEIVAQEFQ